MKRMVRRKKREKEKYRKGKAIACSVMALTLVFSSFGSATQSYAGADGLVVPRECEYEEDRDLTQEVVELSQPDRGKLPEDVARTADAIANAIAKAKKGEVARSIYYAGSTLRYGLSALGSTHVCPIVATTSTGDEELVKEALLILHAIGTAPELAQEIMDSPYSFTDWLNRWYDVANSTLDTPDIPFIDPSCSLTELLLNENSLQESLDAGRRAAKDAQAEEDLIRELLEARDAYREEAEKRAAADAQAEEDLIRELLESIGTSGNQSTADTPAIGSEAPPVLDARVIAESFRPDAPDWTTPIPSPSSTDGDSSSGSSSESSGGQGISWSPDRGGSSGGDTQRQDSNDDNNINRTPGEGSSGSSGSSSSSSESSGGQGISWSPDRGGSSGGDPQRQDSNDDNNITRTPDTLGIPAPPPSSGNGNGNSCNLPTEPPRVPEGTVHSGNPTTPSKDTADHGCGANQDMTE